MNKKLLSLTLALALCLSMAAPAWADETPVKPMKEDWGEVIFVKENAHKTLVVIGKEKGQEHTILLLLTGTLCLPGILHSLVQKAQIRRLGWGSSRRDRVLTFLWVLFIV